MDSSIPLASVQSTIISSPEDVILLRTADSPVVPAEDHSPSTESSNVSISDDNVGVTSTVPPVDAAIAQMDRPKQSLLLSQVTELGVQKKKPVIYSDIF